VEYLESKMETKKQTPHQQSNLKIFASDNVDGLRKIAGKLVKKGVIKSD